jgi:hypothetical protein
MDGVAGSFDDNGLVSRMYLQERPPVANPYSCAIFIGWGAVIVSLILERLHAKGVPVAGRIHGESVCVDVCRGNTP